MVPVQCTSERLPFAFTLTLHLRTHKPCLRRVSHRRPRTLSLTLRIKARPTQQCCPRWWASYTQICREVAAHNEQLATTCVQQEPRSYIRSTSSNSDSNSKRAADTDPHPDNAAGRLRTAHTFSTPLWHRISPASPAAAAHHWSHLLPLQQAVSVLRTHTRLEYAPSPQLVASLMLVLLPQLTHARPPPQHVAELLLLLAQVRYMPGPEVRHTVPVCTVLCSAVHPPVPVCGLKCCFRVFLQDTNATAKYARTRVFTLRAGLVALHCSWGYSTVRHSTVRHTCPRLRPDVPLVPGALCTSLATGRRRQIVHGPPCVPSPPSGFLLH